MSVPHQQDVADHAAAVLRMFEIEPRPLDRTLSDYLRKHRQIGSRLRRQIADAVFGVARWRRRLDGRLAMAGEKRPTHRQRVLTLLETEALPDEPMPPHFPGGAAAWHSFPDHLYERFVRQFGDQGAAALADRLNTPARPCLRVNTLRADRDQAIAMLAEEEIAAEPAPRSPFGILLERRVDLARSQFFARGIVEVQDESSQLACLLAEAVPGAVVLDACAGAGGKSLALAMLMRNQGRIVAADVDDAKLRELALRSRRAGLDCVQALSTRDLEREASALRGACDLVFIDAPCSGTGTLRRSPDLRWRLSEEEIAAHAFQQRELIARYAGWVRPGGRLLYATCSLLREENEEIIAGFLHDRRAFRVLDAREIFGRLGIPADGIVSREGFLSLDPRGGERDGFFAAVLLREG